MWFIFAFLAVVCFCAMIYFIWWFNARVGPSMSISYGGAMNSMAGVLLYVIIAAGLFVGGYKSFEHAVVLYYAAHQQSTAHH